MNVLGMGLDLSGDLLFPPADEGVFAEGLASALSRNAETVQVLAKTTLEAVFFRKEIEREIHDPGDPRQAGWTYLVNRSDPYGHEIKENLAPLAAQRGMANPAEPLLFNHESQEDWFDWLHENYYSLSLEGKKTPQYILIVGGPDQIPFRFQSILSTVANVGRVHFEDLDDLTTYVHKLIRIENAPEPLSRKEVVVFAPDGGLPDPTYFSKRYMADPLAEHMHESLGFDTHTLSSIDATKTKSLAALQQTKPALVYTASHGLGALDQTLEVQQRYNGAICCQRTGSERRTEDWLFAAHDIPLEEPFLEGAIFFQFACFGYGTPAESDYAHWLPNARDDYPGTDFVAAIPKKLLAHPRGPIAYIGHLDTAFLHGFADVSNRHIDARWHTRIAPFKAAVEDILGAQPSGLSMRNLHNRYSVCNALITNIYDREKRGRLTWTPALKARFLDNWITRGDAQNYMVFGDPAARPRIQTG